MKEVANVGQHGQFGPGIQTIDPLGDFLAVNNLVCIPLNDEPWAAGLNIHEMAKTDGRRSYHDEAAGIKP